jgi:putative endopeptidase
MDRQPDPRGNFHDAIGRFVLRSAGMIQETIAFERQRAIACDWRDALTVSSLLPPPPKSTATNNFGTDSPWSPSLFRRYAATGSIALLAVLLLGSAGAEFAHGQSTDQQPPTMDSSEKPIPGFDPSSIDTSVNPCDDMYKFACGKFAANHPIPADQTSSNMFNNLHNVDTQELSTILAKAAVASPTRTPDEQKIGDFYASCMDTDTIDQKGLAPLKALLDEIAGLPNGVAGKPMIPALAGKLQRYGINAFFGFGEQQDFKDSSKQIAVAIQGGLGMPEKDYYLRAGAKDEEFRKAYVAHVAKMLTLAGSTPAQAAADASAIMGFETALAKASLGVTEMRDPENTYHLQPIATFESTIPGVNFKGFLEAIHSPHLTEINNATPAFFPAMLQQVRAVDMATLKAYMRYQLLTSEASYLPKALDDENFDFYHRILNGQPQQRARWKRCSDAVNNGLGEALGRVYVEQYFAGDSKAKMLTMVHDIESAMGRDIDQLEWMSPATKVKAKEKLALVANKIGYPDKWRDYSSLDVVRGDAVGNDFRATAFENDRELNKIGKPVDHNEWGMTPPTVNAYYDPSMNDINFPAGILQPAFYDRAEDDAVNYGHIGAVIGHELTHGFDDEGKKFDGKGNLSDWWTAEDTKKFEGRTDCLVSEYGSFTAVDDVHVNGKLTLGENTADNGGVLLAYMAYMQRSKLEKVDLSAKKEGYNAPQRFFIAFTQNWCENTRPEAIRAQVLQDPHSPPHLRANGAIVNQPGFAEAFGCKKPTPMVPANSCRVW